MWGALLKLIELAQKSVSLLKNAGDEGIRSDELAELLGVPKRRVYDVVAVLRALSQVTTNRRFNGTTVVWIDRTKNYVKRSEFEDIKIQLENERMERKDFQTQLAETKEILRRTKSKMRLDSQPIISAEKTEYNTTQLRIRSLSSRGFKRVADSGLEVVIETYESGMVVDPSEVEADENEAILKNLQRL